MHEGRTAIKRDLERQEKGVDRAPIHMGQEQWSALPWAGRDLAALPTGLRSVLGRRSWALVGSQLRKDQPCI